LGGGKIVVAGGGILEASSSVLCEKWHSATWYESYGFANTQSGFGSGWRVGRWVSIAFSALGLYVHAIKKKKQEFEGRAEKTRGEGGVKDEECKERDGGVRKVLGRCCPGQPLKKTDGIGR